MAEPIAVDQLLGPRLTLEEWVALAEDVPGEFIDGRLVEEEVPDFVHEVVVAWLVSALRAWVVPRGGTAVGSEVKYALGTFSVCRRAMVPSWTYPVAAV
jgi:Uma2 family endonuclease